MSVFSVICLTHARMQKHYCDCSGAVLNDQDGFDPNESGCTCSECGYENADDEIGSIVKG